ncbi:type V toxin-antitoxin system endoribonuclease antitoxin GhoS [Escherichia coli]
MAMTSFTVRVELRNSRDADYDELHELMEANGFSKTITTDSGNTYYLPSAEYNYKSNTRSKASVAELAESVASQIRKKPKILVTVSNGRFIKNLDKI